MLLAVAARRRDRDPSAPERRSAALRVGAPLPARVHLGAGQAQHADQAAPLPVQPGHPQRSGEDRGDRVPPDQQGRALPAPRPEGVRGRHQEDGAAGRARPEAGDPRRQRGGPAGARVRAGEVQDRGRHPRRGRLQRRLPRVRRGAGARLPRQARHGDQARHPSHRAARRPRSHRRRGHQRGPADRRQLRAGIGRRRADRGPHRRRAAADLSGEGLLLDVPAQGRRPGADDLRRGRAVAGGLVAAGRSPPPDLDRGVRRLRLGLDAARLQQHPEAGPRSVPRRRRLRPRASTARASDR